MQAEMLQKIRLMDFRNYADKEFSFSPGVNVIWGKNAVGKTNLLEAICLLSLGESFKAKKIEELVHFSGEVGMVTGETQGENDSMELSVILNRGMVAGREVQKRKYIVDGASKRKSDFLGRLPVVLFLPEDLNVLTGSSQLRRNLLDRVLSQVHSNYAKSLSLYEQGLRKRNRLLDEIREGRSNRYSLAYWDNLIIKNGVVLQEKRQELIEFINGLWGKSELFNKLKIVYEKNLITEERLEQYKDKELIVGYTLIGPHKDDFSVLNDNRNLATFGSRGEQRMVVLAIKIGEIYFLKESLLEEPLLLLDDIFSELDANHKEEVLRVMKGRQVIVTTAAEEDLNLFGEVNIERIG